MNTYIVTFSLTRIEKKYKSFFTALEKLGALKVLPQAFLLNTDHDIEEMRVALLPYLQKADRLAIATVSGEIAIRNALASNDALKALLVDAKQQG